ncbi:MAG TPA: hypothetical protein VGT60_08180 [Candidatus Limnocylindria bacterium]|nr:hypothetical protein [Candidatus Limnocylindria bacterium]
MDRSALTRISALVLVAMLLLAACGGGASVGGSATTGPAALTALTRELDDAVARLKANDIPGAQAAFQRFQAGWAAIEDGVKAKTKDGYAKIESGITDVQAVLTVPATPDPKKAIDALEQLDSVVDDVVATLK